MAASCQPGCHRVPAHLAPGSAAGCREGAVTVLSPGALDPSGACRLRGSGMGFERGRWVVSGADFPVQRRAMLGLGAPASGPVC